jgi:CheY-like chemotaxis protein
MNPTILLVEDDDNDVFFFKRAAKLAGLTNPLHVAQDGRQAIDYLKGTGACADRSRFPMPSLVLLDLKLPLVMGLEVLKWIRAQPELRAVIVIVFTSSRLAPDIDTAYRLGANSYVVKPSSPSELQPMLAVIKQYWLDLNEPSPAPTGSLTSPSTLVSLHAARIVQSALP